MRDGCRVAEKGYVVKIRRDGKQFVATAQSSQRLSHHLCRYVSIFHDQIVIRADNSTSDSRRRLPFFLGAAAS